MTDISGLQTMGMGHTYSEGILYPPEKPEPPVFDPPEISDPGFDRPPPDHMQPMSFQIPGFNPFPWWDRRDPLAPLPDICMGLPKFRNTLGPAKPPPEVTERQEETARIGAELLSKAFRGLMPVLYLGSGGSPFINTSTRSSGGGGGGRTYTYMPNFGFTAESFAQTSKKSGVGEQSEEDWEAVAWPNYKKPWWYKAIEIAAWTCIVVGTVGLATIAGSAAAGSYYALNMVYHSTICSWFGLETWAVRRAAIAVARKFGQTRVVTPWKDMIDLIGKSHHVKKIRLTIRTPHVHTQIRRYNNFGRSWPKAGPVRPAVWSDIKNAIYFLTH